MFITDDTLMEIADDMQSHFECGSLHSQSRIPEIARHASDELADRGLPVRKSLALAIAKMALMTWQARIISNKGEQNGFS